MEHKHFFYLVLSGHAIISHNFTNLVFYDVTLQNSILEGFTVNGAGTFFYLVLSGHRPTYPIIHKFSFCDIAKAQMKWCKEKKP